MSSVCTAQFTSLTSQEKTIPVNTGPEGHGLDCPLAIRVCGGNHNMVMIVHLPFESAVGTIIWS